MQQVSLAQQVMYVIMLCLGSQMCSLAANAHGQVIAYVTLYCEHAAVEHAADQHETHTTLLV